MRNRPDVGFVNAVVRHEKGLLMSATACAYFMVNFLSPFFLSHPRSRLRACLRPIRLVTARPTFGRGSCLRASLADTRSTSERGIAFDVSGTVFVATITVRGRLDGTWRAVVLLIPPKLRTQHNE